MLTDERTLNILMVEDNEADIKITQIAFESDRFKSNIFAVRDGEKALDFVYRRKAYEHHEFPKPDIILLDINMPKYNGFEILKSIKSCEDYACIPVIMLTSSSFPDDINRSYCQGAAGYIQKPVDFDQLMKIVENFNLYWRVVNRLPKYGPNDDERLK
jgi:CheY-like chemotaxis protein